MDAAARADVDQLRRVLLQVHAVDADLAQAPAAAQRLVVLGDLVALGQIGIEVVLAVEQRARRELGPKREPDHQPEVHRALVGDGQAPRQAEADGAGPRVGRLAEGELTAAEHLRDGRQLHVDLQADDGLEGAGARLGRAAGRACLGQLRHEPVRRRRRWRARARARRPTAGSR